MTKLEESLDFLQRNEEKLWFWGVDRAEDMGFSAEFLREAGLKLDRRGEFPRKATNLSVEPELEVPAFALGPMRRGLGGVGGSAADFDGRRLIGSIELFTECGCLALLSLASI